MDGEVGRLDKQVRPNPSHQLLLSDQLRPFKQDNEYMHGATAPVCLVPAEETVRAASERVQMKSHASSRRQLLPVFSWLASGPWRGVLRQSSSQNSIGPTLARLPLASVRKPPSILIKQ